MARPRGSVYVAEISKRHKNKVYTYYLLRCSYREGGKVRQQTLANLSHLPREAIALLRASLRGEKFLPDHQAFEIVASRRHGDVSAVSAMVSRLGLDAAVIDAARAGTVSVMRWSSPPYSPSTEAWMLPTASSGGFSP